MRLSFGFFFDIERDQPDSPEQRESDVGSHIERSPAEDWVSSDGELVGKTVAAKARPVVGFQRNAPGRIL